MRCMYLYWAWLFSVFLFFCFGIEDPIRWSMIDHRQMWYHVLLIVRCCPCYTRLSERKAAQVKRRKTQREKDTRGWWDCYMISAHLAPPLPFAWRKCTDTLRSPISSTKRTLGGWVWKVSARGFVQYVSSNGSFQTEYAYLCKCQLNSVHYFCYSTAM